MTRECKNLGFIHDDVYTWQALLGVRLHHPQLSNTHIACPLVCFDRVVALTVMLENNCICQECLESLRNFIGVAISVANHREHEDLIDFPY